MTEPEFLSLFSLSHCSAAELTAWTKLLLEFRDCFAVHQCELEGTDKFSIDIPTNGQIVNRKQYPLSKEYEDAVEEFVQENLKCGKISPSLSPYNSPCHVVKKKNNEYRVVHDYRGINEISAKYSYSIPNCKDMLRELGGKKYYSSLDLKSAFMQVPLKEEDKMKTAFTSRSGKYHHNFTPFGFKNVPFQFQYGMNVHVWKDLSPNELKAFFDDASTGHNDFSQHISIARKAFTRLREAKIKLRLDKCQFGVPEIQFLGHRVSKEGIFIDKEKIKQAKEFKPPTNRKQVMRFLGFMNYFHQFIQGYADIASPLFELTRKSVSFVWTEVHQSAWSKLLDSLFNEPVLAHVDFSKQFIVQCDASLKSVGAVILQRDQQDNLRPVLYFSKKLEPSQSLWSATDRELYAIYMTLLHNKKWLWGADFVIETDHNPLLGMFQKKIPERDVTGKLSRWLTFIQAFTFKLVYRKGRENQLADFMSRDVLISDQQEEPTCSSLYLSLEDVKEIQMNNPEISNIRRHLKTEDSMIPLPAMWDRCKDRLTVKDDIVQFMDTSKYLSSPKLKFLLPDEETVKVMKLIHTSIFANHCSAQNLQALFLDVFYNPFVNKLANQVVDECGICCATRRTADVVPPLKSLEIPEKFKVWSIDFAGPFNTTNNGNKHILVMMEHFTRWIVAVATKDQSSETVCDAIVSEILARTGLPDKIISDNGSGFVSQALKNLYNKLNIRLSNSTAYNPRCNGLAEVSVKGVKDCLRKLVQQNPAEWDTVLPQFMISYNQSPQSSTGISPYLATYNVEPVRPWSILLSKPVSNYELGFSSTGYTNLQIQNMKKIDDIVRQNQAKAKEKQQQYFESRVNPSKAKLHDIVFIRNHDLKTGISRKLQPLWVKPSRILDINEHNAMLQDLVTGKKTRQSLKNLKVSNYEAAEDFIKSVLQKEVKCKEDPRNSNSDQCFSTLGSSLPKMKVQLDDYSYYQIFDTAASTSIIPESLYLKLKENNLIKEEVSQHTNIVGLKNENVSLNIRVKIPLKFGNTIVRGWFSVVSTESPLMLIGVNILRQLGFINFRYCNNRLVIELPRQNTVVVHSYK